MHVCTQKFENSHGKAPKGRGMWGFNVRDFNGNVDLRFAPHPMTFTEARRWIKGVAHPHFAIWIEVAP